MATNLFSKAKSTATAKTTDKKDSKVRIRIEGSEFFDKVQTLETLQDRMKSDKAKADMISDEIKDLGKEKWAEMYQKSGRNPGSVMIESVVGGDKYGEVLSRLIEESDEISDDDKGKIIKAVTAFSVAKGTIDVMKSYGKVEDVMNEVKPVIALKNVEIVKG